MLLPNKSGNLKKKFKLLAPVCLWGQSTHPHLEISTLQEVSTVKTLFYGETEFEKYCTRYKKYEILHKPDVMPVILGTKPVIGAWFIPIIRNYLQSQLKIALFYGYPLGVDSQLIGHVEHVH